MHKCLYCRLAKPPRITIQPQELKNTVPGKPVSFIVKAAGTEPLNYQWQWKPVVEGVSSGEWQNLSSGGSVRGADTATLTFTTIESCTEGLYRCVVTNVVGEEISEYTDHIIGKYQHLSCQRIQQQYSCILCASPYSTASVYTGFILLPIHLLCR